MNDRPDRNSRGSSRDAQREEQGHSGRDYSGEMEGDNWGRSGSTGAASSSSSRSGQEMRGDQRTHDWEVGDRNYSGSEAQRSRNMDRGNAGPRSDVFRPDDFGGGARAWSGDGYQGGRQSGSSAYGAHPGRGGYGDDHDGRGFTDRAVDEVKSWFGDEDAARRREEDHRGRGPSDYVRSDERIREDANDRLTEDSRLDARQISVAVTEGELTLTGTVSHRMDKRRAEDLVDAISGVKHVQNNLRVQSGSALEGQGGAFGWGGGDSPTTAPKV